MNRPMSSLLLVLGIMMAVAAPAEIPTIGHARSATMVLSAIRVAEARDPAQFAAYSIENAGVAATIMAQLDRSSEGCVLTGLDGWDDEHVNSAWNCPGRPADYRLIVLKNRKISEILK